MVFTSAGSGVIVMDTLTGERACVAKPLGGVPTKVKLRMPTSGAKVCSGRSSTFFQPPVRAVPFTVMTAVLSWTVTSTLSTS